MTDTDEQQQGFRPKTLYGENKRTVNAYLAHQDAFQARLADGHPERGTYTSASDEEFREAERMISQEEGIGIQPDLSQHSGAEESGRMVDSHLSGLGHGASHLSGAHRSQGSLLDTKV